MDLVQWLQRLGLGQYAASFTDNDIDLDLLTDLNETDLEKLGVVSLGHRKKLLKAIAQLATEPPPASAAIPTPEITRSREAERRQLTVMFCDLVGSTAMSERLDVEDLRDVLRGYQDACAGVISRFEGYIAKYIGDGLLVYFGFPKAHEDDAERAIRAALGIVAALDGLCATSGEKLAVRIGIATGVVVVGDIVGVGASQEEAVLGETPNLAARLQGLAQPNGIIIGPSTRDLIGTNFECLALGPQNLKGLSRPIHPFAVIAEQVVETRFRAAHADRLGAFLGREHELKLLLERWERALAGEGQLVTLSGGAGIGKSRMTEELIETLSDSDRWRVHFQCSPHHVNSPFYPVIQQLNFVAGIARDDADAVKLAKLEEMLARSDSLGSLAVVAALLSISTAGRLAPLQLTPLELKQQTFRALTGMIEGLACQRPILFVVEDAHWVDPTTRDLLDQIAERVARLPIMMLVTHRPEFGARWASYDHCTPLVLTRLGRAACVALVHDLTGSKQVPQEVLEQIIAKTDGVPLFVEELTKTVLESGILAEQNGNYILDGLLTPITIPSTLQDSLMARLDRLNGAKELAQIGAAIGREFSYKLVEAVALLKQDPLRLALEILIQSEIIFQREDPPDRIYTFKHALIQDTAYDTLLRSRRQQIHARIAEVLQTTAKVEPELLAHHYTQAGLLEIAAPHWLLAGQLAVARSANAEATAHLHRGLNVLRELPHCAERDRTELDLQISLGSAQIAMRGYSATETERAYSRARDLMSDEVEEDKRSAVFHGLTMVYWNRAQLKLMRQVCDEMRERAERQPNQLAKLVAHRVTGVCLNTMGCFKEARSHAEQAAALYDVEHHHTTAHTYGHDMGVGAHWHLAIARLFAGDVEGSRKASEDAEHLVRLLSNSNTSLYSALWSTYTLLVRGDWEEVIDSASRMIASAEKKSMALWVAFGRHLLGCALASSHKPEVALLELHQGRQEANKLENHVFLPMTLSFEAKALAALDRHGEALERLAEASRVITQTHECWWEVEVHRTRGEVLRRRGDPSDVYDLEFRSALAVAERQGADYMRDRVTSRRAAQARSAYHFDDA